MVLIAEDRRQRSDDGRQRSENRVKDIATICYLDLTSVLRRPPSVLCPLSSFNSCARQSL
jgi:hypothetical protein